MPGLIEIKIIFYKTFVHKLTASYVENINLVFSLTMPGFKLEIEIKIKLSTNDQIKIRTYEQFNIYSFLTDEPANHFNK